MRLQPISRTMKHSIKPKGTGGVHTVGVVRKTIIVKADSPFVKSEFLKRVFAAFSRRRKAITYSGKLSIERTLIDNREFLNVAFTFSNWPALALCVGENQTITVTARKQTQKGGGKVLFALEGFGITDDPGALVQIFEWTKGKLGSLARNPPDPQIYAFLEEQWLKLRAPDRDDAPPRSSPKR